MANKVSFIFIAQNRYTKIVEKAVRITNKFKTTIKKAIPVVNKFGQKMKAIGGSIQKFGTKMKSAGQKLSLFATAPILLLGRSMVNTARDAEETQSKFDVVFKGMTDKANKMADNLAKDFFFAKDEARELLGNTGDLLNGFGLTGDAALKMSIRINEAAADLNSFKNFSGGASGASAILTKALLGERESLKSLGVTFNEEDVKRKIQIMRANGAAFASKGQAKASATLQLILDKSANSIGDVARTSEDLANVERKLDARSRDLSVTLGKALLPIKLKLVTAALALVKIFTNLSPTTKKIILVVAGLVAVLGPLALLFAGIVAIIPAMVAGFGFIAVAIGAISLPITGVIIGITALIAGILSLKDNWLVVSDAIGGTIEQISINFEQSFNKIISSIASVKEFFGLGDEDLNINKRSESIVKSSTQSRSDVNVNLRAPQNTIESIKSRTTGKTPGLNVGVNMAVAG